MEEHEKILQMLEEGKLKAEEASRLFEALKLKFEKRKLRHLHKHLLRMKRHGFGFDRFLVEDDCREPLFDSEITDCIGPVRIRKTKHGSEKESCVENKEVNSRILKMLKEGKITSEEASELLKAVRKSYASEECTVEIEKGYRNGPWSERHHFSRHHCGPDHKRVVIKLHGRDFDCCD